MRHFFDSSGTIAGLEQCLAESSKQPGTSGLLILCGDDNGFSPHAIDPLLKKCIHPIAGGVFPGIIFDGELHKRGSLVVCLRDVVSIQTVEGLSNPGADYEEILDQQMPDSIDVRTLILFVDGFATRVSSFIESLFNVFGLDFNYVGGGAGSLSMQRKPYLFTSDGMKEDCAILAFLETASGIGVCHGWQELSGPYQVTSADKNIISSIEWQPAFEFYRKVLKEKKGIETDCESFYHTAQHYPFGIARLVGEQVVRDPMQVGEGGSIICVGEIDEGAFITILQSNHDDLIRAAAESLQRGIRAFPQDKEADSGFFVDCISRTLILGDQFSREIMAVQAGNLPFFGICSIGEIANSGADFLELYNKTSVMAVLAKK